MINPFKFYKFHAAGNDFIVLDYFSKDKLNYELNHSFVQKLCHRQLGVGADGVVVLKHWDEKQEILSIDLYNSDGGITAMCANGTRCALALLKKIMGWKSKELVVSTLSGQYQGRITETDIWLSMESSFIKSQEYDVKKLAVPFKYSSFYFANSGVPHSIFVVPNVAEININEVAPLVRSHEIFSEGCNVNFVTKIIDREYKVRTYERGVEGETLSCGTGILAISSMLKIKENAQGEFLFHTPGGPLKSLISLNKISYGGLITLVYSAILESQFFHASR